MVLKTSDVEKYFDNMDFQISRPRIYPQFQVNENEDDAIMPMSSEEDNDWLYGFYINTFHLYAQSLIKCPPGLEQAYLRPIIKWRFVNF